MGQTFVIYRSHLNSRICAMQPHGVTLTNGVPYCIPNCFFPKPSVDFVGVFEILIRLA